MTEYSTESHSIFTPIACFYEDKNLISTITPKAIDGLSPVKAKSKLKALLASCQKYNEEQSSLLDTLLETIKNEYKSDRGKLITYNQILQNELLTCRDQLGQTEILVNAQETQIKELQRELQETQTQLDLHRRNLTEKTKELKAEKLSHIEKQLKYTGDDYDNKKSSDRGEFRRAVNIVREVVERQSRNSVSKKRKIIQKVLSDDDNAIAMTNSDNQEEEDEEEVDLSSLSSSPSSSVGLSIVDYPTTSINFQYRFIGMALASCIDELWKFINITSVKQAVIIMLSHICAFSPTSHIITSDKLFDVLKKNKHSMTFELVTKSANGLQDLKKSWLLPPSETFLHDSPALALVGDLLETEAITTHNTNNPSNSSSATTSSSSSSLSIIQEENPTKARISNLSSTVKNFYEGSFIQHTRLKKQYSSTMDTLDVKAVENFWIANSECSPRKDDVVRRGPRKNPEAKEEHARHYMFGTNEEMYNKFRQENPTLVVSKTKFMIHKPWFIHEGKSDTCLCIHCENFRLLTKSLEIPCNRRVLKEFSTEDSFQFKERNIVTNAFLTLQQKYLISKGQLPAGNYPKSYKAHYDQLRRRSNLVDVGGLREDNMWFVQNLLCPLAIPIGKSEIPGYGQGKPCCYDKNLDARDKCKKCGFENRVYSYDFCMIQHNICGPLAHLIHPWGENIINNINNNDVESSSDEDAMIISNDNESVGTDDGNNDNNGEGSDNMHYTKYVWQPHHKFLLHFVQGYEPFDSNSKIIYEKYTSSNEYGQLDLMEMESNIYEFMKYAKELCTFSCHHQSLVSLTRKSHILQEYNQMPQQLLLDIDFSENFAYSQLKKRVVQSMYFVTSTCTIFVGILRFLSALAWNSRPDSLEVGDEVSVKLDNLENPHDLKYVYGLVVKPWRAVNSSKCANFVKVQHPTLLGKTEEYPIVQIRKRKPISVSHIVVSNTHNHDTTFVQYYLENLLLGQLWDSKQPFSISNECGIDFASINELHIRSDGASSHFKQGHTLYQLTQVKHAYKEVLSRLTWTFNAPGHGKGPWDGVGGNVKNIAKKSIIKDDIKIQSPKDVFNLLQTKLESEEYTKSNVNSLIKKWKFDYIDEEENMLSAIRNMFSEITDALPALKCKDLNDLGTRELFSFEAIDHDCLVCRKFPCWCMHCVQTGKAVDVTNESELVTCPLGHERWGVAFLYPLSFDDYRQKRKDVVKDNGLWICNRFGPALEGAIIAYEDYYTTQTNQHKLSYKLGVVVNSIKEADDQIRYEVVPIAIKRDNTFQLLSTDSYFETYRRHQNRQNSSNTVITIDASIVRHVISIDTDCEAISTPSTTDSPQEVRTINYLVNKKCELAIQLAMHTNLLR